MHQLIILVVGLMAGIMGFMIWTDTDPKIDRNDLATAYLFIVVICAVLFFA